MGPSLGWLLSISLWAPFLFTCAHHCDDHFGLLDVLDGDHRIKMDLLSSRSASSPGRGSFLRVRASFPDAWISVLCPGRRGPGCHWPPPISKNSSVYSHHDSLSRALQLFQCFDRYSLLQFILLTWRGSHTASMGGDIETQGCRRWPPSQPADANLHLTSSDCKLVPGLHLLHAAIEASAAGTHSHLVILIPQRQTPRNSQHTCRMWFILPRTGRPERHFVSDHLLERTPAWPHPGPIVELWRRGTAWKGIFCDCYTSL